MGRLPSQRRWLGGLVALTITAACAGPRAPAESAPPTLRIIGTNDFHGGLEARPNGAKGKWGGAAALAGGIRRARAECVAPACYSILVDAGDEYQGQAASTLARGAPVSEIFNYIGYDVAALGNHDLDWGADTLRLRLAQQHYPVLSANLQTTDGRPVPWIGGDTILRRGPFAIGIVGVMTMAAETAIAAPNLAGIRFVAPAPVIDAHAAALRQRGANVVIVVAHAGAECGADGQCRGEIMDVARSLTQPVDAIIAGHRHLMVNTRVNGMPITSASTGGEQIDVIDLARGQPARSQVRNVYVDSVPGDTAVARMVAQAVASIGPRLAEPVATIADEMPKPDSGEFALGNLIVDAYRAAGHADLAVMNHAAVRAPLHAGRATFGALFEVQPFGNQLVRITATGAAVRQYVEALSTKRIPAAFISGARVRVDPTRPAGSRVLAITLDSGTPLDDRAMYTVVINDFMQGGGDGMAFPDSAVRVERLVPSDLDATIAYLRAMNGPVHAPVGRRWIVTR